MKKIFSIVLPVVLGLALATCTAEEKQAPDPNVTPETAGVKVVATVNSLEFSWNKVDGATAYEYKLNNGKNGSVKEPKVSFAELDPDTEYVLNVEAKNGSEVVRKFEAKARTEAVKPLAAPIVKAEKTGTGKVTVKWEAVQNAAGYEYAVKNEAGKDIVTIEEDETSFYYYAPVAAGKCTITVTAKSEDVAFSDSDPGTCEYVYERTLVKTYDDGDGYYALQEIDEEGYYVDVEDTVVDVYSAVDQYDDGTYVIRNFCGVDGRDLEFSLNGDGSLNIHNAYYYKEGYFTVDTGREVPQYMMIYPYWYTVEGYGDYCDVEYELNSDYGCSYIDILCYWYDAAGNSCTYYYEFNWDYVEQEEQ